MKARTPRNASQPASGDHGSHGAYVSYAKRTLSPGGTLCCARLGPSSDGCVGSSDSQDNSHQLHTYSKPALLSWNEGSSQAEACGSGVGDLFNSLASH